MMKLATAAYGRAPVWLQNLLITGYGVHLRRLRFGPTGRSTLAALRQGSAMTVEEARASQRARLAEVIDHALRDVPYYRRRGSAPTGGDAMDRLRALPLLTKSDVQEAGREMISDRFRDSKLTEIHTGGTTGKPLAVFCDAATLQRNYAFFTHFKECAGVRDGERVATFAGRLLVPAAARAPYWRHNRAANTLLFSSYHIGAATLPAYVAALERFAPAVIDSYPSSIEPVARYIVEQGITTIRPTAVITSSETLFPSVRTVIEQAFGCPVFDHYGGAEMVALITQCAAGSYHVASEFGVVELLDNGRPVSPGERGEIVATGFINPVMPLLRYATGDSAILGDGHCACGRTGQTITSIEGRIDDVIETPDGHLVGRLDPIFKAVSSLYETRIIQDEPDHVRVEMVVQGEFAPAMERELTAQLRARLGPRMRIDLVRVPRIERTARGKLRTTVNLVRRSRSGITAT
jgi:phenylacetate-CoA ligase